MKKCHGKCGLEKEDNQFSPAQLKHKNGQCRECTALKHQNRKAKKALLPTPEIKKCSVCKKGKASSDFSSSELIKNCGKCRECVAEYDKKKYEKDKTAILDKAKECYANLSKEEKLKRYEKEKIRRENWTEEQRAINSKKNKLYYEENKEKIQQQKNDGRNARRLVDPAYRLRVDVSTLVRRSLLQRGASKNGLSIEKYLPQSIEEIVAHIEGLWSHPDNLKDGQVWMNWDNYGSYNAGTHDTNPTWNIDHIIPQSDLPYTSMEDDNFKICWNIKNLRPLDAKQNWLDGISMVRHKNKTRSKIMDL
jgi:hypothetical protein